ncbi:ABC transporter ATPase [Enterobacter asburiae]|jgi:predicted ATPase|uniref:AAA family ATPase n=1 Tax=Enterobacter TaxID=547 RepID=UPI0005731172|nr:MULTISPECIES: AAA family ATPase [Enterobacter]ALL18779.1 ABC transporter ATP-binding protein [Enterobacter sp. E20]KJI60126.1 ABC transporter ATPase [Enterobacter asburiae]MCK7396594.1 AAA family ATPase [Enterobacter bugandensis]
MFRLASVKIEGFWGRLSASCSFNEDVNIIIGRNGTGKTTFMNILHSVLALELESIGENSFDNVTIKVKDGNKNKTIKIVRKFDPDKPLPTFEYTLSRKKFVIRAIDDRRIPLYIRRKYQEDAENLKIELDKLVSLASLSVYRLRSGEDLEVRDNYGSKFINPIDFRLDQLLSNLTKYQLSLSQRARDVSANLQKEVLASILYSKEDIVDESFNLNFDKESERRSLTTAYSQLGAFDSDVRRKINFHVEAIDQTVNEIKLAEKNNNEVINVDYRSFEALRKTQRIIKMSLKSEEEIKGIFAPINLFTDTLHEFITDKKFSFISGELILQNGHGPISHKNLSSGEKQLLILFIETLLQQNKPFIYLTDEPELSLHIAWQRKIIPAIKRLNPNAQIIAATHSPEVASKYRDAIFDMEKLVHG